MRHERRFQRYYRMPMFNRRDDFLGNGELEIAHGLLHRRFNRRCLLAKPFVPPPMCLLRRG